MYGGSMGTPTNLVSLPLAQLVRRLLYTNLVPRVKYYFTSLRIFYPLRYLVQPLRA